MWRKTGVAVCVLLMALAAGCAQTMKAKLQQADAGVYGAIKAIDKAENDLYVNGTLCGAVVCVDAAAHKQFSKDLLIAIQAGKTFHLSILAWREGQPVPVDVINVSAALKAAAETVKTAFASGPGRETIAALIDAGAFAVNQVLLLVLPQQAADALMPPSLFPAVAEGGL
jgi:hypothetical protein